MAEARGFDFTFEDGTRAVELAREAIRSFVLHGQREHPGSMREAFYNRTGAIVRIESSLGRGGLRGCAGEYDGTGQLGHAIVDAAIAAASADSCGSELGHAELGNVTVSVCIVRDRRPVDEPLEAIELGRHGIAIANGAEAAWMYPTVPVENGWTAPEYLERTCRKAHLPPDAWRDDDVSVELFEGTVYREREPEGSVEAF